MKKERKNRNIENVSWKADHRIKHVIGFVVEETETFLKISSTRNSQDYEDVVAIGKELIIERQIMK